MYASTALVILILAYYDSLHGNEAALSVSQLECLHVYTRMMITKKLNHAQTQSVVNSNENPSY